MHATFRMAVLMATAVTSSVFASHMDAQSISPDRDMRTRFVVVTSGVFVDDINNDGAAPFVGAHIGRAIGRFVVLEGTASYVATATKFVSTTFDFRRVSVPLLVADVGLSVQVPVGPVIPYLGAATGAFYRRGALGTANDVGWTEALFGGGRIRVGDRYLVQGEMKLRNDLYDFGPALDAQFTFGLGVRF